MNDLRLAAMLATEYVCGNYATGMTQNRSSLQQQDEGLVAVARL
jgi:hypothetical protein